MKKNLLANVFGEFGKGGIRYGVRTSSYKRFPGQIEGKDVDLLVEGQDFGRVKEILRKLGFIFYRCTEPHYIFYGYDSNLGLMQVDILLGRIEKVKEYKGREGNLGENKNLGEEKNLLFGEG
jgi:hypothetical protein